MPERGEEPGRDSGPAPFGRYLLDELLARGGMGEVFRAIAVGAGGFEKPVVVKRILPSLGGVASMSKMFIDEARLMSRLVHPNIVQVIDFGQGESDDYFLVMELVDGVDLRAFGRAFHDRGEPFPIGLAVFITTQILRGLSHAHTKAYGDGRTLVHRDISPGNVLLSRVGEVKVADFGVALVAEPDGEGPKTLAGKPGYMAPEQIFGGAVDGRADVFSVGVVLHQMLSGGPAFIGEDDQQQQASASLGRVRDLRALRPDAGADLTAVVEQALAVEADERFATARAMSKAIDAACRAANIGVASPDELADHVERVADSVKRSGKKVVDLSDGGGRRQLTRTGAFTMRVTSTDATDVTSHSTFVERSPVSPRFDAENETVEEPPLPEATILSPPMTRLTPAVWLAVPLALGIAGFAVWWSLRDDASVTALPTLASSRPGASAASSGARTPVSSARTTSPILSAAGSATEVAPTSRPSAPRTRPTAPVSTSRPPGPTPAPPPPPPDPPANSCSGTVILSSRGSWWVSGGPKGRQQSPAQATWPCGTYGLTAVSRVDGKTVSRTVTVRDGKTASARFE